MSILSISLLPISLALSPSPVVDKDNVQTGLTELSDEIANIHCTEVAVEFDIGGVTNQTQSASCTDDLGPVSRVNLLVRY